MALDLVPDPTARRAGETDWRRYSSTREGTAIQANHRLTIPACSARVRHRDTSPRPRMRAGANNLSVEKNLFRIPIRVEVDLVRVVLGRPLRLATSLVDEHGRH